MTTPDDLRKVLRKIDYETLELLVAFDEHGTFTAAAKAVSISERTVKTRLEDLSKSLNGVRNTPILENKNGRRYQLTEAGKELASQAAEIAASMRNAIESIEGGRRVEVVNTSNCCEEMVMLKATLDDRHDFTLAPRLLRTMEIEPSPFGGPTFLMYSSLMSSERVRVNQEFELPGGRGHIIIFKIEPIELLVPKDASFELGSRPAVRKMLNSNLTMCVPPGGVAWNFMQQGWPRWESIRYRQYFHITDLDAGLEVLRTGLAGPRAAMVVHGLGKIEDKSSRLHRLRDKYTQLPVLSSDAEVVAVTGLVRVGRRQPDPIADEIWKTARELWITKPEVIREIGGH